MQTKSLKYTTQNRVSNLKKRVFEVLVSLTMLLPFIIVFKLLVFRRVFMKKDIFITKTFFLNSKKNIDLKFFNIQNSIFKNLPLFLYILSSKISLVGVFLVEYKHSIKYKVEYKPGIFSLWFIRKNSKMTNSNISDTNKEYVQNSSLVYDIKIIVKSIITSIYSSKRKRFFNKVEIFDVAFDNLKLDAVLNLFKSTIDKKEKKSVFFINADCLNKTFDDLEYKEILKKSDLVLPDGSGVNIACNLLKKPLLENLNGTDMLPYICHLAQKEGYRIFLLGAQEGVAFKMSEELRKKYPKLQISGVNNGFLKNEDDELQVIKKINQVKTDILLVAMGAPMQEKFIAKYKDNIDASLCFAVGGLFDFYSKKVKRAPLYLRETGFEWVYRIIQEPKRMWKRYVLGNPLFLYRVFIYIKDLKKKDIVLNYLESYDNNFNLNLKKSLWSFKLALKNIVKRVIDILASFILLIVLSPLFLVISLIIKLTSKGDVFFVQKRVGLNGDIFDIYKFRSMVENAEELKQELKNQNQSKDGVIFKIKNDYRITKIGKFIRKTSIDELPQLFNVLKGDMSLVGPRPPLIEEVKQYNVDDKKRLNALPGITCIWQVSGRSKIPFKEQVKMDKKYIKTQSLFTDIVLLFKTIPAVIFQKGSY